MRKKALILPLGLCLAAGARAEAVDFNKIVHWTGEGDCRAVLVIQFDDSNTTAGCGAVVWGYRWSAGSGKTTDEMMREVASGSQDLIFLRQLTGTMGYTLDGVGYGPSAADMLNALYFDAEGAENDSRISFGYLYPNTGMGQKAAPGTDLAYLVEDAVYAAAETHYIDHPLNYEAYGYPAYDYDYWKMGPIEDSVWKAGWYDGYWSFWTGKNAMEDLSFSGMGMTSILLEDGDIAAWRFTALDGSGGFGDMDAEWLPLNYLHFDSDVPTGVKSPAAVDGVAPVVYTLDGRTVETGVDLSALRKGIYIIKTSKETKKILIH